MRKIQLINLTFLDLQIYNRFIDNNDLDKKIAKLATKAVLKAN